MKAFEDSTTLINVSAVLGSEVIIDYGESRIKEYRIGFGYDSLTELEYRLWIPANFQPQCLNKLVILTPGYKSPSVLMHPLASEIVRQGYPVLIFSMRGDDLNSSLKSGYGIQELVDLPMALWSIQEYFHIKDSLHIAVLGSSLGGSLSMYSLKNARNNEFINKRLNPFSIRAVVLESYVPSMEDAAKKLLTSSEFTELTNEMKEQNLTFANIITDSLVSFLPKKTPLMVQWGQQDKLVSEEDRQKTIDLLSPRFPNLRTNILKDGTHALRIGYPMSADEVIRNNKVMVSFLIEQLQCR